MGLIKSGFSNLRLRIVEIPTRIVTTSARFVGGWGFNPPLVPLNPQVCINPEKIVKISQKYIADPPLVYPQIKYW